MGAETKPKALKHKLKDLKKPIIGAGIIAVVAITGIVGGIFFYFSAVEKEKDTLTSSYGGLWWYDTLFKPRGLGPSAAPSSIGVINQIAEGLFEYEITNEYTRIVPNLALGEIWSSDGLNLTCLLREGVKFHDGTPFNAYAVKWNFDRLQNLLNNMSYPNIWYDEEWNLILNRTEIIDDYTVRFVLNRPFVPFKAMLCSLQSYILSPNTAPLNNFIEIDTNLIGTGPFKYDSSTFAYEPVWMLNYTVNTTLLANPDYWDGPPKLNTLIFKFFVDGVEERYEALLSGEIQLTSLWPYDPENYTSHPGITLNYIDTPDIWLIFIKNNLINATMRKALSYAINYTKLLAYGETLWEGGVIRARSPLSKGMLYSNWKDFDVPYYNITIARQVLKDINWNGTAGTLTANDNITAGNEWESLVTNGTPLAIYNVSYNPTKPFQIFYKDLLVESFKQIGVEINQIPVVSGEEYKNGWSHFIYWLGWGPDYNDPRSNINPLFSSKADGYVNLGEVNDTLVQQWMEAGLTEMNETVRAQYYYDIQKRLIEVVYPCIWTYTERLCNVHGPNLRGINYYLWPYKDLLKDAHF
ncbi:MAG: ABC transporter substrate-binding protein [Promethearchaeota archaeon]